MPGNETQAFSDVRLAAMNQAELIYVHLQFDADIFLIVDCVMQRDTPCLEVRCKSRSTDPTVTYIGVCSKTFHEGNRLDLQYCYVIQNYENVTDR